MNDAVLALIFEGGIAACTFGAVAAEAGVERSTLYRRYGDRWAMMIDVIIGHTVDETSPVLPGSFREDLRFMLQRQSEILATPLGPALWAVAAALRAGMAPEHRERFWRAQLEHFLPIVEAAKDRGELPRKADAETMLVFALGAIHFRMLSQGQQVSPGTIGGIVDAVCHLHGRSQRSIEMQAPVSSPEIE